MLLGSVAAYYKYGDRTDIVEKSLRGTNDALERLLAYLGTELYEALSPVLVRAIEDEASLDSVKRALKSESFLDAVSDFVNGDVTEILQYRVLTRARSRWTRWARRMSWGVFILLVQESFWTFYFAILAKVFHLPVGLKTAIVAFTLSGLTAAFSVVCAGAMLHYHDQITDCRETIL